MDLVQWLTAQLDADERIARAATPSPWVDQGGYVTDVGPDGLPRVQVTDYGTQDGEPEEDNPRGRADSAHITRHDPARVLREIEAKRRTLLRCGEEMFSGIPRLVHFAKQTVREMAAVYEDRPGYEAAVAAFE